ncbi:MAG: SGNH/GDSL hydrolase family protein [Halioglobus sp.]|nr:SGNH/GDSL hydrolase family protein [Halioglobus sp.]
MRRFVAAEPEAGWLAAVWVLSGTIAAGFIWATLQKNPDKITLPADFAALVAHQDLLLGSSLSRTALPHDARYTRVLHPDRETLVASLPNISEAQSLDILAAAVAAGAHTVLLEVNAFAHEYNGLWNCPWATTLAGVLSENGRRLTLVARAAVGLSVEQQGRVRLGRFPAHAPGMVLAGAVAPALFPRAVWDGAGLEAALADARRHDTVVLLFWPPLPESGYGRDRARYAQMSEHIRALAKQYALPLWLAPAPWPDGLFMDHFGHLNASGRERFAAEIGVWVRSR